MNFLDWKAIHWSPIVSAALALYSAGLTTYTVLSKRAELRRLVKVKMARAFPVFGTPGYDARLGDDILMVTATNPGARSVRLVAATILLPNGKQAYLRNGAGPLPHDLDAGKSFESWIDWNQFTETLREEGFEGEIKLVGVYRDAIGTEYRSKRFKFTVKGRAYRQRA